MQGSIALPRSLQCVKGKTGIHPSILPPEVLCLLLLQRHPTRIKVGFAEFLHDQPARIRVSVFVRSEAFVFIDICQESVSSCQC